MVVCVSKQYPIGIPVTRNTRYCSLVALRFNFEKGYYHNTINFIKGSQVWCTKKRLVIFPPTLEFMKSKNKKCKNKRVYVERSPMAKSDFVYSEDEV